MTDTTITFATTAIAPRGQTYAPGTHPDLPSPVRTEGPIFWMQKNLLSSPLNVVLTIVSVLFILVTVPPFLDWALFDAAFSGDSRKDC